MSPTEPQSAPQPLPTAPTHHPTHEPPAMSLTCPRVVGGKPCGRTLTGVGPGLAMGWARGRCSRHGPMDIQL